MDDEDIETLNQREADRMSWCLADVMQVHGDPGFGMGRSDTWGDGTPLIYPSLDPTAANAVPFDAAEPVPAPSGEIIREYGPADGRRETLHPAAGPAPGRKTLHPAAGRTVGGQAVHRATGRAYRGPAADRRIEPAAGSESRSAQVEPQPAVGWHAPDLPALSPADVMPTAQPPAPVVAARSEVPAANRQPARFPGVPAPPARSTYPSTAVVPRPAAQFPYVK